jgi:hypothetical protein
MKVRGMAFVTAVSASSRFEEALDRPDECFRMHGLSNEKSPLWHIARCRSNSP